MIDIKTALRPYLSALMVCIAFVFGAATANQAMGNEEAEAFIQELGDKTVAVVDNPDLSEEERIEQISVLVDEGTDLDYLAKRVLGKYWRSASDEERAEFSEAFRAYTLRWIADKINKYEAKAFEVTGSREANDKDTVVITNILLQGEEQPIPVQWAVRESEGRMLILNIIIDTYNMLVTQRSVIGDVVSRDGMEGVIALLNDRAKTGAG